MTDQLAPALEAVGVTKRFGDAMVIDRLDLVARRGEVLGLVGPNGAGKSMILRMCCGLVAPTKGAVRICGRDMTHEAQHARAMLGYLDEDVVVYPYLTGDEFLDLMAHLHGFPRGGVRRARIDQVCLLMGLGEELSMLTGRCSYGVRKKIAIAAQLIHEPEVLLLDEPTNGLDPLATRHVKDLVRQLAAQGRTVLLSTHVLDIAEAVCDRVALINGGRLVAEGSLNSLRERMGVAGAGLDELFLELSSGT
jgi:ABC-2 type transport system ATP-binding protein